MENGDNADGCVFPLTSLQIGDLQSYLSHLSLLLACESKKFYILVDNRPWLTGLGSKPVRIWQFIVTKLRLSPFANTRAHKGMKDVNVDVDRKGAPKCSSNHGKHTDRWFSLIDTVALSRKKAFLPMKKLRYSSQLNRELHETLFGLIVFEISWANVRGINYLNELQTDTSLAIESNFMKRWEFDSILQAVNCMSSWFSGSQHERILLRKYLLSTVEDFSTSNSKGGRETTSFRDASFENESFYGNATSFSVYPTLVEDTTSNFHTPPPNLPCKRRKVTRTRINVGEGEGSARESPMTLEVESCDSLESTIEASEYRDTLLLFRFDDRDLPFRLRDIIVSDPRLLTLLEAGLPSWVIFLQSYPVFCHLYKPWMCPLARVLYVLISVATVLIGFYDLYKNVPLLKATASHLFGPLFDWIETWEMVSRIKYLGTMLFLHNFEKAVHWFLMISRAIKSFCSVLAEPMMGPLMEFLEFVLPLWNTCIKVAEMASSFLWILVQSSFNLIERLTEIILFPIWFVLSFIWSTAIILLYPVYWVCKEVIYAPIRLIMALASFVAYFFTLVFETLEDLWLLISSIFHIASATESTVTTYEATIWSSLWKELFSQVFRALRSILNGFVAFFAACNRHRLSIYNHLMEFFEKLSRRSRRTRTMESQHRRHTCRAHYSPEFRHRLHHQ